MGITKTEKAFLEALRKFGITDDHLAHPLKSDVLGMNRVAAAILREQPFLSTRVYNTLKANDLIEDATHHYIDPDTRALQVHSARELMDDTRLRFGVKSIDEIVTYLASRNHPLRLREEGEVVSQHVCRVYRSVLDSSTDDAPVQVLHLAGVIDIDQLLRLHQMGIKKLENFKATTRARMKSSSHYGLGLNGAQATLLEEELSHYGIYLAP